jgi:hypothetical protein
MKCPIRLLGLNRLTNLRTCALLKTAAILLVSLIGPRIAGAFNFGVNLTTDAYNYSQAGSEVRNIFDGPGEAASIAVPATVLGIGTSQTPTGPIVSSVFANATAIANLGTGQLQAFARADGPSTATAKAIFYDILTLIPQGGFVDSSFPVTFNLTVDSVLSGNALVADELQVSSLLNSKDVLGSLCSGSITGCFGNTSLTATVNVLTSNPIVFVQSFLSVNADNCRNGYPNCSMNLNGIADAGHTAQISLQLPPGFTFTSDSGVFLTQVPEPNTAWLLTSGLLAIATTRRRRCRGRVADRLGG